MEQLLVEAYNQVSRETITPNAVLDILKDGNRRFLTKELMERDLIHQVGQTAQGQWPIAAILSCIDSRIPVETVFDLGIGDVFSARIAGNFVNPDLLGSLEFACKVAGAKAIVVMGHTGCGAIKGVCDGVELGNLTQTLSNLRPAVDAITDIKEERNSSNPLFVQKVADKNVELTLDKIKNDSPVLRQMIEDGEIVLVGAMYDVATGKVTFS